MIIALLTGGPRAIIEARKSSPAGSKTCWAYFCNDIWLTEILLKEFDRPDSELNNNDYQFAAFRGTDNAFMLFKLSARNLVAHKTCNHTKLLKLLETRSNYNKIVDQHNVDIRTAYTKVSDALNKILPDQK